MITILLGLAAPILKAAITFCLGKILTKPDQIRSFLGAAKEDDSPKEFDIVSGLLVKIGVMLMILAAATLIVEVFWKGLFFTSMNDSNWFDGFR